jgi:hypothetical protein
MSFGFDYIPAKNDGTMVRRSNWRDDPTIGEPVAVEHCPCGYRAPHDPKTCEFNPQVSESEKRLLDGNR